MYDMKKKTISVKKSLIVPCTIQVKVKIATLCLSAIHIHCTSCK